MPESHEPGTDTPVCPMDETRSGRPVVSRIEANEPAPIFEAFPDKPDGIPASTSPGAPIILAFAGVVILLVALHAYHVRTPARAPSGIDPATATLQATYESARQYADHGNMLREKGSKGWDDTSILQDALENYRMAWSLLTGKPWVTESTWYGARDYRANDAARPCMPGTDAEMLLKTLQRRIIELEDATDAFGLW